MATAAGLAVQLKEMLDTDAATPAPTCQISKSKFVAGLQCP